MGYASDSFDDRRKRKIPPSLSSAPSSNSLFSSEAAKMSFYEKPYQPAITFFGDQEKKRVKSTVGKEKKAEQKPQDTEKRNPFLQSQKARTRPAGPTEKPGYTNQEVLAVSADEVANTYNQVSQNRRTQTDYQGFRKKASPGYGKSNPVSASLPQQEAQRPVKEVENFANQNFVDRYVPSKRQGYRSQNTLPDTVRQRQQLRTGAWQPNQESNNWEKERKQRARNKDKRTQTNSGYTVNVFDKNGGKSYTIVDGLSNYNQPTEVKTPQFKKPQNSYSEPGAGYGYQEGRSNRVSPEQGLYSRTRQEGRAAHESSKSNSAYRRQPENQNYQSYRRLPRGGAGRSLSSSSGASSWPNDKHWGHQNEESVEHPELPFLL